MHETTDFTVRIYTKYNQEIAWITWGPPNGGYFIFQV